MKAKIIMVFDKDEEYEYGKYDYNTAAEKKRVNELAMEIRKERNCDTYIEKVCDE